MCEHRVTGCGVQGVGREGARQAEGLGNSRVPLGYDWTRGHHKRRTAESGREEW